MNILENLILELCSKFINELDFGFWKFEKQTDWNIEIYNDGEGKVIQNWQGNDMTILAHARCIKTLIHEDEPTSINRVSIDLAINNDILLSSANFGYIGSEIRTPISWDYMGFNAEIMAQRLSDSLTPKESINTIINKV